MFSREVVLTIGDEDLLPLELVAAPADRLRPGAHRGEIGSGLRLGEIHGAAPFAGDHLRQVRLLQPPRSLDVDRLDGPASEHRAKRERHVGAAPHLIDERREYTRQVLAPEFARTRERVPTTRHELVIRLLPSGRGRNFGFAPANALPIADPIERRQNAPGESRRLLENRFAELERRVLEARQPCNDRVVDQLAQHELHVRQRRLIFPHLIRPQVL